MSKPALGWIKSKINRLFEERGLRVRACSIYGDPVQCRECNRKTKRLVFDEDYGFWSVCINCGYMEWEWDIKDGWDHPHLKILEKIYNCIIER